MSTGEICLRWCIDQDIVPITTSGKEQRLSDYLRAMTFKLTPAEIKRVSPTGSKDSEHALMYADQRGREPKASARFLDAQVRRERP